MDDERMTNREPAKEGERRIGSAHGDEPERPMAGDSRTEDARMTDRGDKQTSTAELAGRGGGQGSGKPEPRRETGTSQVAPLMSEGVIVSHKQKWQEIQAAFVDQPQDAVRDADSLVAEIIQTLTSSFADQRHSLEEKWSRGSEVSTEDLRRALQQYRSFFERLLAA
jgi:hypothetical protein